MGISTDANPPMKWSETKNLKWKTKLPGPRSSSPIVVGDRVYVMCYSGYAVDRSSPGRIENLKRHLLCINRGDGIAWCLDAKNGELVYLRRLRITDGSPRVYASCVVANKKSYLVSRDKGTFVLAAKPEFEQLAQNRIASDNSDFQGSPAISGDRLFLRSNQFPYCIEDR